MHVIQGRNAHTILPEAMYQMRYHGVSRDSRNGPVMKFPGPATICYANPLERVVFWAERDCNPFFHLMESLWMLAGRNDTAFLTQFVSRMSEYSDDGETFHGAYGFRWRQHFGADQLESVVQALSRNHDDRRCVVQMWDSRSDLGRSGKDFPCNTQVVFSVNDGCLDMSVFNRSNDLVWGALGANAVHFSFLLEYMAARIGVPVGKYWQISNNMHLYIEQHFDLMEQLSEEAHNYPAQAMFPADPYSVGNVAAFPLMSTDPSSWERELFKFLEYPTCTNFVDPFFQQVAHPMFMAHQALKMLPRGENYKVAVELLEGVVASDWRKAATEWVLRRQANYLRAQDDGPIHK